MTRLASAAALSVAVLCLVGCVKTKDHATVSADGSGSYTESVEVDMSAMESINQLMKEMTPATPGEAPKPDAPKEDVFADLRAELGKIPGLEVTKATSEEKAGKNTLRVEAKFDSLETYAKASQLETGAELVKNDDGSYTLRFLNDFGADAMAATGEEGKGPGKDGAKPEDPMAGLMKELEPVLEKAMAGLELTRTLTLPGKIVETNGTKDGDSTVSWKVTYEDVKKAKKEPHTVTFRGEGLELKPFKVDRKPSMGVMSEGDAPPVK